MPNDGDLLDLIVKRNRKQSDSNAPSSITPDEVDAILHGSKKKADTVGSNSGLHSSTNGLNNSPLSQTDGFRPVSGTQSTPIQPQSFTVDQTTTNPIEIAQKQQNDERAKQEAFHPGSWSNTLPHLTHALVQTVTKPLAGVSSVIRDIAGITGSNDEGQPLYNPDKPIYNEHGVLVGTEPGGLSEYGKKVDKNGDTLGHLITGLDAYNNATDEEDQKNALPHTFLGNTASGLIGIAPDIATTALFPEGEALEASRATALTKLKSAVWNPFTKVMATKGGLNAYNQAEQHGSRPDEALVAGAKGAYHGALQGAEAGILGGIAGEISPKVANALGDAGLIKDGKLTKMGVDAATDAAVFGLYPAASALVQGKPINTDEMEAGIGTGLAFGLLKAKHTEAEFKPTQEHINEILQDRQAAAIQNFMNASPQAIEEAYKLPDSTGDINAEAVAYAHKAKAATDIDQRNQFVAAASTLAKSSDVKGTVEAILNDRNGFVDSIQQSELPDEQKSALIAKIDAIHKQIDPTEKVKTDLGNQIQSLDADIKKIEPIATTITDPVHQVEAEVAIEKLTKQKEDLRKKLKETISKQYEPEPTPETAPIAKNVPTNTEQASTTPDNSNVGDNQVKEGTNAIPEQSTGEMGFRQQNAVGEEVGKPNNPIESTSESANKKTEISKQEKPTEQQTIKTTNNESSNDEKSIGEKSTEKESGSRKENAQILADEKGNVNEAGAHETVPVTKKLVPLSKKGIDAVDNDIQHHGITYNDVKNYEQSRERSSRLPESDRQKPTSVSEDVQQSGVNKKPSENENTESEGVLRQSEKPQIELSIGDNLRKLADKIREGKIKRLGGYGTHTPFSLAWDGSLEIVAKTIDGGAQIADAIEAGLKHIRETDFYKNLIDKDKFEKHYSEHLNAELNQQEQSHEKGEGTGISKADVKAERESVGKQDIERKKFTKPEIIAEGKRLVESGELNPELLAKDMIANDTPISAQQLAALEYHKVELKNERLNILDQIDDKQKEGHQFEKLKQRLAVVEDAIDENQQATTIATNVSGRTTGFANEILNEDFSRGGIIRRAKIANGGKDITKEDEENIDRHLKRIDELENKLRKFEENKNQQEDGKLIDGVKRKLDFENRKSKRTQTRVDRVKEREELLSELSKLTKTQRSTLSALPLPIEAVPILGKLARSYVADGLTKLSDVVDKVFQDVQDKIDDIDKKDILNAIKDDFDKYLSDDNKNRLVSAKDRLTEKLNKIRNGEYSTSKSRKLEVDKDYLRIKADIAREQSLINKRIHDIEFKNNSIADKSREVLVKWSRAAKLTGVSTLGKLASTGLVTSGLKVPEEAIGGFISKIIPKLGNKANVEGGFSVKALAKGYTEGITQGMKDSADILNIRASGKSDLEALFGKNERLPPEALDFFGHLHSAIKAPVKRTIFEYSLQKRIESAIVHGLDPTDPIVQTKLAMDAYEDGNRAIFMGKNKISEAYEQGMRSLENGGSLSKNIAAVGRMLLPFVKVPTNIALSTGRMVFGLPIGVGQLAHAFARGLENIQPEEADAILKNLKRGAIGSAALLVGFLHPQNVGGYYQKGEHRKDDDVKAGGIKLFGEQIPIWLTEHPFFQAMQIGATFRRVLDKRSHDEDKELKAGLATTVGLVHSIPLADQGIRLDEAISSPKEFKRFSGEFFKGNIDPSVIREVAEYTDRKNWKANMLLSDKAKQKRETDKKHDGFWKTVYNHIISGIPVARETLHKK